MMLLTVRYNLYSVHTHLSIYCTDQYVQNLMYMILNHMFCWNFNLKDEIQFLHFTLVTLLNVYHTLGMTSICVLYTMGRTPICLLYLG